MKEKALFNEIHGGNKYHSAIFTTFSFNMYYWEIQVLKELRAKGIEHISALVDERCLSEQFELFSNEIADNKAKGYSLYGYRSDMSFHPKIIFLAGENSVLALVGSGNVTPSGHGKNIEVWCPIAIDSTESPQYSTVRDIWSYISSMYNTLGEEAQKFIGTVEDNCSLLKGVYKSNSECITKDGKSIKFLVNGINGNLFNQLASWVGNEKIEEITIMTPFYDEQANLIKELNDKYSPIKIKMIIQKNFGMLPYPKSIPNNVEIYDWKDCSFPYKHIESSKTDRTFHSKCIVLKGKTFSYMIVGSANASISAMGGEKRQSLNHEAVIAFKAKTADADFWKETQVYVNNKLEFLPAKEKIEKGSTSSTFKCIWLKEVSYDINSITINYSSSKDIEQCKFVVYTAKNEKTISLDLSITKGDHSETFKIDKWNKFPLFAKIETFSFDILSNSQFIISSISMAECDPSPMNMEFRRYCLEIESGNIINSGICKFLHDICIEEKYSDNRGFANNSEDEEIEEQTDSFVSADEYNDGADESKQKMNLKNSEKMRYEQSLLNSILSHLTKMQNDSEKKKFEAEEDSDETSILIDKESLKDKITKEDRVKSEKTLKNVSSKLAKTYKEYYLKLVASIADPKKVIFSNNFEEAKEANNCFMAILILEGYMNYYVKVFETTGNSQNFDLPLLYSSKSESVTEYTYSITSLFGLKNIQYSEIKESEKTFYTKSIYKKLFETACGLMSVCDVLNKGRNEYEALFIQKPSAILNLRDACDYKLNSIDETVDRIYKHFVLDLLPDMEFDEYDLKKAIETNLGFLNEEVLAFPNPKVKSMSQNELINKILFNTKTGYVSALGFLGETKRFSPISWSGLYDFEKKFYTLVMPDNAGMEYHKMITDLLEEKFLPIKPKE